MKKLVQRELTCCDFCDSEDWASHRCLGCKKDLCRKCAVHYSLYGYRDNPGMDDGYYCKECDVRLKDDCLHKAWVELQEFFVRKDAAFKVLYDEGGVLQAKVNKLLGKPERGA